MEPLILEAERELESIRAEMHSPEVVSDAPRLQVCYQNLQSAESRVESLYARWADLEAKQQ
jgi:ATP-binding cassette subfamily F protein uup